MRPTVALRIHPPQDTAEKNTQHVISRTSRSCNLKTPSAYAPTQRGSGVLQCGRVALTHVATSWPRTWKPGSQWKCA